MTDIVRSIQFKLNIDPSLLSPLFTEWIKVCNYVSQISFHNNQVSNNVQLHKLTYKEIRSNFKLNSQLSCNAIRYVASKYATIKSLKHKIDKPVDFNNASIQLQLKYDFSYSDNGLSLSSLNGRIKNIQFDAPPHIQKYQSDDWQMGGAILFTKHNKVYLSQTFHKAPPDKIHGNVMGIDKGINYLATVFIMSNHQKCKFFGGGFIKHKKKHYQNLKSVLQSKKAQKVSRKSRSLRRLLKQLSSREHNFVKNTNHIISKHIINLANYHNISTIVTENLEGIRQRSKDCGKSLRKLINGWSFYELQSFINYKAEEKGIEVVEIDPKNTSRQCSRCGYCDKKNRHKHNFICGECGYQLHSDLNAAKNIRQRYIIARYSLCDDGLSVNQPGLNYENNLTEAHALSESDGQATT